MQTIVGAEKIFTGSEWISNCAVEITDGVISNIFSPEEISTKAKFYKGAFIAPGFIDSQIYGASGKLFSAYPVQETLQVMQEQLLKCGTGLFQPTVATNEIGVFKKAIDAVKIYWGNGGKGVYGLHLEGPWLHPDKRGAHVKEMIHAPGIDEVKEILEYGKGIITMITLAPEVCSDEILELICSNNVIISAGHSNATYGEAQKGFNKGITTVTHLYNAMSPLHHREPGLTGATLNHHEVMASIIPDGHHVHFEAIAIAKKIMGERLFVITDAVTETGIGPYPHNLQEDKYESNGTLSGSALTMYSAFKNLVEKVGIPVEEALKMCSLYPAKALKCGDKYGKIEPGFKAPLLVLDNQLQLQDVVI